MSEYSSREVTDETIIKAVKSCYQAGKTDNAGGGVAPQTVANHDDIPYARSTVSNRLSDIARTSEKLTRVQGLNPDSGIPRVTYAPSEEVDEWPTKA